MRRLWAQPRANWRESVESQGFIFPTSPTESGGEVPYWYESAVYEISESEALELESATERLYAMCVEASHFMASGQFGLLGLPDWSFEHIRESLEAAEPSLYARFDLSFGDGRGVKLLELNGDTPTGLVESSVAQWHWLNDVGPQWQQFNRVHDMLINRWAELAPLIPDSRLHLSYLDTSDTHEEQITCAYMQDCATQAGLTTSLINVNDIGMELGSEQLVDLAGAPITAMFKLYPWENMLSEPFGRAVLDSSSPVTWVEPLWKVLLSNKALLAALWHIYPEHELLLPAYLDSPQGLEEWIAKPLHGREGDGIHVQARGIEFTPSQAFYGEEGYCYQQWDQLPDFDGNYAVLGSWVVGGKAAGLGIRESDGPVTDFYARFVPHLISNEDGSLPGVVTGSSDE